MKKILSIIILIILVIGIVAGVYLVKRQQDLRSKATTEGTRIEITDANGNVINSTNSRNVKIKLIYVQPSSSPSAVPSPTASSSPVQFVQARGNKLYLGDQEYVAKGVNFAGGTYLKSYIKDGNGIEQVNRWQIYHDKNQPADATGYNGGDGFDSDKINQELAYLKNNLGVNTIRIFTTSKGGFDALVRWHKWEPWFMEDGSINPVYLNRLKSVIDLAGNNGIKVQLEILHNYHITDEIGRNPLPVGGDLERFYFHYIDSLASALANNTNILSYEVGNETMIVFDINYWNRSDYEANILSFETRMIRRIRSKDPNHLIASSGQVVPPPGAPYNTAWHWPSPELALIKDVDNLNNGNAFSLYSLVDYISPHFYLKSEEVSAALALIKQKSNKPIIMGEFGYQYPVPDDFEITKSQAHISSQEQYYTAAINAVKNNQTSGLLAWDPVPMFSLQPDKVKIEASGVNIILTLLGPPQRKIIFRNEWYSMYNDNFSILKWDGTFYPAGEVYKTAALANSVQGVSTAFAQEAFPTEFRIANSEANLASASAQVFNSNPKIIDWNLTEGNGIKTVYAQFKVNNNWSQVYSASLELTGQVIPVFEMGLEAGAQYDTSNVNLVTESNVSWVRLNFIVKNEWSGVDDPSFINTYNTIINAYMQKDLKIIALIGAESVKGGFDRTKPDEFIVKFTDVADKITQTFGDRVKVYELFNEPNDWAGGNSSQLSPENFANLMKSTYQKVKVEKGHQDITLVSGPIFSHDISGGGSGDTGEDYLRQFYAAAKNADNTYPFDAVGLHIYVAQGSSSKTEIETSVRRNLNSIEGVINQFSPEKRIWISEMGWGTGSLSEQVQADNLEAAFNVLQNDRFVRMGMWFTLKDFDSREYGLVRGNGDKKIAFQKFVSLATQIRPLPSLSPSPSLIPTPSPSSSISPSPSPSAEASPSPKAKKKPDFNKDGKVNSFDVAGLYTYWGSKLAVDLEVYDLNGDGVINSFDYAILLQDYNP